MEIFVRTGQTYRVKPNKPGAHTKYVRIARVTKGQQPKATVKQVTRTGRPKRSDVGLKTFMVWLTWNAQQSAWTMPSSYHLE